MLLQHHGPPLVLLKLGAMTAGKIDSRFGALGRHSTTYHLLLHSFELVMKWEKSWKRHVIWFASRLETFGRSRCLRVVRYEDAVESLEGAAATKPSHVDSAG